MPNDLLHGDAISVSESFDPVSEPERATLHRGYVPRGLFECRLPGPLLVYPTAVLGSAWRSKRPTRRTMPKSTTRTAGGAARGAPHEMRSVVSNAGNQCARMIRDSTLPRHADGCYTSAPLLTRASADPLRRRHATCDNRHQNACEPATTLARDRICSRRVAHL